MQNGENATNEELKERLEKLIEEKAPKIKGSEGNAEIIVNICSGYNFWTSADCRRCKYKDTIIYNEEDGTDICESPEDFECPDGEYQDEITITIAGDLRDAFLDEVSKQVDDFIEFVKREIAYNIRVISIKAHEDWTGHEKQW